MRVFRNGTLNGMKRRYTHFINFPMILVSEVYLQKEQKKRKNKKSLFLLLKNNA